MPEIPSKLSCSSSKNEILEKTPIKSKEKIKRVVSVTTTKKKKNISNKKYTNRSSMTKEIKNYPQSSIEHPE